MEVFPFVFSHSLEHIYACFEDRHEDLLSDFVKNMCDRALEALPARDVVFGEFSLDITKEEDVTWCKVRAVSWVRCPLDLFV
jgi:hypothetical protein